MQHKTLKQLEAMASFSSDTPIPRSRRERLERWAAVLDREPQRRLRMLVGTEYQPRDTQDRQRCQDSPISVAFEDPVLRAAGLHNDSYGAARQFFELSDRELHRIVCYCHNGLMTQSSAVAGRVRAAKNSGGQYGFIARAWSLLTGR